MGREKRTMKRRGGFNNFQLLFRDAVSGQMAIVFQVPNWGCQLLPKSGEGNARFSCHYKLGKVIFGRKFLGLD